MSRSTSSTAWWKARRLRGGEGRKGRGWGGATAGAAGAGEGAPRARVREQEGQVLGLHDGGDPGCAGQPHAVPVLGAGSDVAVEDVGRVRGQVGGGGLR